MKQLGICAFGAIVITCNVAFAQGGQPAGSVRIDAPQGGMFTGETVAVLIGQDKAAPLCPEYCAPRRVTTPEQATVGERDVLSYTMAAAADGSKLHVDSGRTLWAQAEKLPSMASPGQAQSIVTQDEFRPALDPVLAAPTTGQVD